MEGRKAGRQGRKADGRQAAREEGSKGGREEGRKGGGGSLVTPGIAPALFANAIVTTLLSFTQALVRSTEKLTDKCSAPLCPPGFAAFGCAVLLKLVGVALRGVLDSGGGEWREASTKSYL